MPTKAKTARDGKPPGASPAKPGSANPKPGGKVKAAKTDRGKGGTAPAPEMPKAPKVEPFSPATVLVVGGYGTIGSAIVRCLLEQSTTVTVIIAGRDEAKAAALSKALEAEGYEKPGRTKSVGVDATQTASLAQLSRFDVMVNATTILAVESIITLMRYASSKRAHYLDLRGELGMEGPIAQAVGEVGPVCLTGGGYCPGILAPILKATVGQLSSCLEAHLSIAATALPSQANEAVEAMLTGSRLESFRGGKWLPTSPKEVGFMRKTDFGDGKARHTTPVGVAEVKPLPEQLGISNCSVRFASEENGGLMCAAMAVLVCAPCLGLKQGITSQLHAAMARQQAREPNLCACVCEATGVGADGKARKVVLRAQHAAGPASMAAHCVVAQVTQILTNSVTGGKAPSLCGLAMDSQQLLASLQAQGVNATVQTFDAADGASYNA